MDVTQEIYHLATPHRSTAGSGYFNNVSVLVWSEPHARVLMPMRSIIDLDGTDHASRHHRRAAIRSHRVDPRAVSRGHRQQACAGRMSRGAKRTSKENRDSERSNLI
ncbi:MAG: hypothetical protein CMJ83_07850 [Planctomycetes bacterium]|nr:hypothetical protein [Planctomycetota bacterium]